MVVLALQPPGYRHRELLGDAALHVLVVAAAVHRRGGRGAGKIEDVERQTPWEEKIDKAVWRGTGWFNSAGNTQLRP